MINCNLVADYRYLLFILNILILTSCVTTPPKDVTNVCHVFHQYPNWYHYAADAEKRWKVPVAVQMAIMYQESKFNSSAQPARTKLLYVIPGARPSTAYGYTQALNGTWDLYRKSNGKLFATRDSFSDGVDFIGWYANMAYQKARISPSDAYSLYLAYHEGVGGYQKKTYLHKRWLLYVANKVAAQAKRYQGQLNFCFKQGS